jgi:hypothetical protein
MIPWRYINRSFFAEKSRLMQVITDLLKSPFLGIFGYPIYRYPEVPRDRLQIPQAPKGRVPPAYAKPIAALRDAAKVTF